MKDILRHATGVIFLFFLLSFLFVSAVKFQVLRAGFWSESVRSSGIYNKVDQSVALLQSQLNQSGLGRQYQLDKSITSQRVQQTAEENIRRIVDYLDSKSAELVLYLPINEWGLPAQFINQTNFRNLTAQTKLSTALGSLGMKTDQVKQIEVSLAQIQKYLSLLTAVWLGLLAITVAIGWLYFRLGLGLARIKEIGFLLTLSGVATAVVGFGATILGGLMLRGSKGWPAWAQDLCVNLITQFFALGKNMGILLALAGIFIWVGAIVFPQQGEIEKKRKKTVAATAGKNLL